MPRAKKKSASPPRGKRKTQPPKGVPPPVRTTATPAAAEEIARRAHRGQKDRAGRPYIRHIERVTAAVADQNDETRITAWLHDIVEDTKTTFADLAEAGFGTNVIHALRLLTRDRDNETYTSYIDRLARSRNRTAIRVKVADLQDHLQVTPEALTDGLHRRYQLALQRLDAR
jgi:(p)ppGpp synthase/HD superfamily hydrolase